MSTRFLVLAVLCCTFQAQAAVLFSTNSTWRLFRGTNEASLPDTALWRTNSFNDVNFANAPAPFWYGDVRDGGTQLSDMLNVYTCVFLRKTFTVPDASGVGAVRLTHFVDDGFVLWLNGKEIYRENVLAGNYTISTLAANQPVDPAVLTNVIVAINPGDLRTGENLVAVQVFNAALNSSDLGFDLRFESVVAETVPPVIQSVNPPPGNVTALTQITVTFSEPVEGVNADDLLLNTQPAMAVSGSGTTYTFSFAQPLYGNVSITWFPTHGIQDEAFPPNAFDGTAPGNIWQYNLMDVIPPVVSALFPPAGVVVRSLNQIEVTFDEEVTGVNAGDLLINGQPATSVNRIPGGPYVFQFPTQPTNTVQVQWLAGHGITDQAEVPNAFGGGAWSYVYDPNASPGDLVINEIVASNQSGLVDEDGENQDWIEIYNRGVTTVNLANWSLSDDPEIPGLWTFPARSLAPGEYLVIFASGKNRKPVSGPNRMHTVFQLGQDGEHLGLYTPDSPRVLASGYTPYPEQRNDTSYGYDSGGSLRYFGTPTPGGPNGTSTIVGVADEVHFSVARGSFTQPFNLALTCPTPGTTIRFTTDGTVPTADTGRTYLDPLRVTNTMILRAAAFRTNLLPSTVATHTYFFGLTPARLSLPIISLVTANSNLHGRSGIIGMNVSATNRSSDGAFLLATATEYHNPSQHGIAWERPVSAEYILPQDNSGFQIDAGIRVQGSDWQRPRTTPASKFSFRLYFRGDYGKGRLEYPLFPLSTVESFDQVVLRAGFNDNSNPFIRDELTRRLSHDMGQVASHGGFMNLFTNGVYWGYYNPTERVHSEMMQSYLGGSDEWDVVAPSFATSASGLGVVDGDRNDFQNMMTNVWGQTLRPVTNQESYVRLSKRLDLVNFTDYCLLNAYAAMGDWPANNWRAARDRNDPNALWRFIVWDAEWANGFDTKTASYDTFAQVGTGTLDAGLNSTVNSEIARLYQALRQNREFRLLWADRIHKHFFNGGALMSLSVSNRVQEMRDELQALFTITEPDFLNWHRDRLAPLFSQFNTYGLYGYSNSLYGVYASSNAPAFNQHGGAVVPGFALTMTAPLGGTIYFTTNGHDPRVPFSGAVSNAASIYSGAITLNQSMTVKARTLLDGTNWSALAEADFQVALLGVPLRVTELNYNPTNSAHEFIEIQNIGGTPVDLGGMTFSGISYNFPHGSMLGGGQRLVLVTDSVLNPAAFAARYPGVAVFGYYSGSLNNGGETISLQDVFGNLIFSVTYDNGGAWPSKADGAGSSLEIINANGDPDDPANWRASTQPGGSPGNINSPVPAPLVRLNEVMAENGGIVPNSGTFPDWVELFNPGAVPINLEGWSLTDDGNARKFVFPSVAIAAGAYLVVWCDDTTNTSPGLHSGFSLGQTGDNVYLYDAATNRVDALSFGLQLVNSTVGRVGSDWVLTTPTPNAANGAAPLAPASSLVINEWLANPPSGQSDWLEIHNTAALPVALRGLYLSNTSSVHQITSLSFIAPQGFVQLFADELVGPDHLDFKLPSIGGSIVLYDQTAAEIDRVTYAAQVENISRGRLPDGSETFTIFPGTASPAASNYASPGGGAILINEVLARNQTAVTNAGRVADFVELYNPGVTNFPLDGFSLSVDVAEAGQWPFPLGASVPPGGYLVIWCDGSRPATIGGADHNTGRSLDGDSGGVYLFNPAGQIVNSVEYGFQIVDRSIGLVSSNWRLLTSPTPGAVNQPAVALGPVTALRINEWMANPVDGGDWFEIYNSTNQPADLNSLVLTDDPSTVGLTKFRIAPLSFVGPNGFVRWEADNDPQQGRNHVNFSLNEQGETLRLLTQNGAAVIDSITFGAQGLNTSEGRLPDGQTNIVAFPGSPTPEERNYLLTPDVVINELLSHTDVPLEDAIELHIPGTNSLNIGGWFLSDSQDNFKKYRIPDNTLIPPGGFAVFYQGQFGVNAPVAFTLDSARGDEVWLSAADAVGNLTGFRTGARFGAAGNGVSIGRVVTSVGVDYAPLAQRSFGVDNPGTVAQFRSGTGLPNAAPLVGPVVINELMYHPADGPVTTSDDEYIELRNLTASSVPLFDPAATVNTWRLGGGIEFTFPQSTTLAANGLILVVPFAPGNAAALAAFRTKYNIPANIPVFGPYSGQLNNAGESVELYRPDTPQPVGSPDAGFVPLLLVDKVDYRDNAPWPSGAVDGGGLSLQRRVGTSYGNEPINWLASAPTPGAANGSGVVPPPIITASPASQQVLEGESPELSIAATGAGPVGYQWRFNGTPVPSATNAALAIDYAVLADNGDYDCVVSNPGGAAVSAAARLTVLAPAAVVLPPSNSTNRPGANVTFTVIAKGSGPLRYQWRLNGSTLVGETNATLVRNNVQLIDDGEYDVLISNSVSTTIASARLIILVNTAISVPPLNVFVVTGATYTVSVAATGNPLPFGYEWRQGPLSIASNTVNAPVHFATFTAPMMLTNNQPWRVVVRNLANSGTTANLQYTVTTLQDADSDGIPDIWESNFGFNAGSAADRNLDSDNDGATNWEEYLAGTNPTNQLSNLSVTPGALGPNSSTIQFGAVSNRSYSVQYIDSLGSGSWMRLADIISRTNARTEIVVDPEWKTNRFYRVVTPRQP